MVETKINDAKIYRVRVVLLPIPTTQETQISHSLPKLGLVETCLV